MQITSSTNAQFKIWKSLLSAKGIKENGLFFLMGEKLVNEFLDQPAKGFRAEYLVFDGEITRRTTVKKTFLSKELFQELDVLGTSSPILIISYIEFPVKDLEQDPKGLEIICPLGDPRNLGALIRTAVGFG